MSRRGLRGDGSGGSAGSGSSRISRLPMELYLVKLSPPSRAVWLYLLQNKLPHVIIDVDFSAEHTLPDFLQTYPHKGVPVLVDGDIVVFEGPAILQYLATSYTDHAGYRTSMAARMTTESLISWANAELHRVVGATYAYPSCLERYRLPDEAANDLLVDKGLSLISKHLEQLEKGFLQQREFLTGDKLTIADSFVATVLLQAEWAGFKFTMWPRVKEWLTSVQAQDLWTKVHAEHKKVVSELEKIGI